MNVQTACEHTASQHHYLCARLLTFIDMCTCNQTHRTCDTVHGDISVRPMLSLQLQPPTQAANIKFDL